MAFFSFWFFVGRGENDPMQMFKCANIIYMLLFQISSEKALVFKTLQITSGNCFFFCSKQTSEHLQIS